MSDVQKQTRTRSGRSRPDMGVKEFRALIDQAVALGLAEETNVSLAQLIGVHRLTVGRWLAGAPINSAMAALIRTRLASQKTSH